MQDSKSKELGITSLDTDHNGSYLIFYEPDHLNILGVLKRTTKSTSNEQSTEEYNSNEIIKWHSPGRQKYSNGKLVEEWE